MKLIEVFDQLNSTNSVKDKEDILRQEIDNEELKTLLEANLNPHKLFQFNKMPVTYAQVHTYDKFTETVVYRMFKVLLTTLETRKLTGNKAKEEVKLVFCRMNTFEFELYSKILLKAPIGVGASTVNKVWPDLIPEFKLMLAPNKLPNVVNLNYPLYLQPKLDGYRCIYKEGLFFSRKGMSFGNENLLTYFNCLEGVEDYVLDGELYIHGQNFNKLQTGLNTENTPVPKGLKYVVYDCIPLKDWNAQSCKIPYKERLQRLRSILNDSIGEYTKVIDIASDEVNNSAETIELYKKYLKNSYEGAMLKDINGLYQWKRVSLKSGEMLKLKPFKTEDLKVIGTYEGEGALEGTIGGIIVDFNGCSVRCGSGFSNFDREEISRNQKAFIGKIAEIRFLEETEDGSLRHPTFERWRDDK
jgi:DNA ligase 1